MVEFKKWSASWEILETMTGNAVMSETDVTYGALCQAEQDRQCTYNVTLTCVHATVVAVEKQ